MRTSIGRCDHPRTGNYMQVTTERFLRRLPSELKREPTHPYDSSISHAEANALRADIREAFKRMSKRSLSSDELVAAYVAHFKGDIETAAGAEQRGLTR